MDSANIWCPCNLKNFIPTKVHATKLCAIMQFMPKQCTTFL